MKNMPVLKGKEDVILAASGHVNRFVRGKIDLNLKSPEGIRFYLRNTFIYKLTAFGNQDDTDKISL